MKKSVKLFTVTGVVFFALMLSGCIGLSNKQIVNSTTDSITVYTTLDSTKTYTLAAGQSIILNEPNWSSVYAVQSSLPTGVRVATKSYYTNRGKNEVTEFFELTDTYTYTITNTSAYKLYVYESVYGISSATNKNTLVAKDVNPGSNITVTVYTENPEFKAYYRLNDSDPESKKVFTTQFTAVRVNN